jgi:hypothetical protein
MLSRRDFLLGTSAAIAAAGAIHPLLTWAQDGTPVSGKDGMILRSFRFLDLEMPPEYANSFITPCHISSCATTCTSPARSTPAIGGSPSEEKSSTR